MRGLFNKTLGACSCAPFVPKNIDPFIIGAGISAAASIGSGVASGIQASNLNKENREYDWRKFEVSQAYNTLEAERSRAHQKALLQREQDWNEKMYNQYNSPSAMRAQYEAAGYHPYLASPEHGVGASQMQASSPSAPASPQGSVSSGGAPATYMSDVASPMRGMIDSANLLLSGKRITAESANQQAQALNYISELIPKLHSLGYSDEEIKSIIDPFLLSSQGLNVDNDVVYQTAKVRYQAEKADADFKELQAEIYRLYGKTEKADEIMLLEQKFDEIAKNIGLAASTSSLNDAKIKELSAQVTALVEQSKLDKINRNLLERSLQWLVDKAQAESYSSWIAAGSQGMAFNKEKVLYDIQMSEFGQFVERTNYYLGMFADDIGKFGKVHIGFGNYNTNNRSFIDSKSNSRNWNINEHYNYGQPRARGKREGF